MLEVLEQMKKLKQRLTSWTLKLLSSKKQVPNMQTNLKLLDPKTDLTKTTLLTLLKTKLMAKWLHFWKNLKMITSWYGKRLCHLLRSSLVLKESKIRWNLCHHLCKVSNNSRAQLASLTPDLKAIHKRINQDQILMESDDREFQK